PAISVLEIATRTGAAAIGLADQVGSLEVGKRADVIQLSLDAAHLTPRYDAVSHLVYAADSQDVRTVIVDGQVIMEERQVLTLDEAAIKRKAREIAREVGLKIRAND
ncbi:MAG: amidohydrolase family protein, partial [Gammaproteobacteria bacterium]